MFRFAARHEEKATVARRFLQHKMREYEELRADIERMRAERTKVANELRALGREASETIRAEMIRVGREPLPQSVEASVPLGSTDMGNVTQMMPGIHPVVGIEANGASIHQPEFTVAAAGPSADRAVTEGAIMLARTVVALAQAPDERVRVLQKMADRAAVQQQVKAGRG